ncbi:MAG: carboxy terminal-processing peptidase [Lysobacteraceae bacterium]|nr:carboxy terminal-processing peptidase [Xanthomonadaceae bacterium]HRY00516.1 carboxy terminal-processing peptidase [Xanthomonadaceae bacterium]
MLKRSLFSLMFGVAAVGAMASGQAMADAAKTSVATLAPEPDQDQAARYVAHLLSNSRYHYRAEPLDDAMSEQIYKRYLDSLDSDKLFFVASDIAHFDANRDAFDDAIRSGELQGAFDIFNVYLQRVEQRTAEARKLLKRDWDFSRDESYDYDREKATWAKDSTELDELWRQRVKNDWLRLKLAGKEDKEIRKTLDRRYVTFEERVQELKSDDVFQTFLNAYALSLDPHTSYMTPRTSENFSISMRLSLEGIGAVLQRNDEYTVIRSIVPGGPAALSGQLKVGDRIVAVGQGKSGPMTDVVGWRIDDVVDLIRGPKDSTVRLEVLPTEAGIDGEHEQIALVRQKVKLEEQAAKKSVIEVGEGDAAHRIGVIKLPGFYQDFDARRRHDPDYRSATRDVAKLLQELKAEKVDGVVIDLRNNGGGSLTEAIELTGLFIDQGPVVQVKNAGSDPEVEGDTDAGVAWDGPLAVLVNRASASASEIFSGAIQDYGRGLIIGEPTYGKGTVQNLVDLDMFSRGEKPRYGQLKLTVAQFFRVAGGSTQNKGVVPDIAFPVTLDAEDYGESSYDNALPWAKVAVADFHAVGNFTPLTPLLEARHEARVAKDPEFQWWAQDVANYRKQRKETVVSLNEATRRAERDDAEAKRQARAEERKKLGKALPEALQARADDGLQAGERAVTDEVAREEAAEDAPDVLLRETAAILADAIDLLSADKRLAAEVRHPESVADLSTTPAKAD